MVIISVSNVQAELSNWLVTGLKGVIATGPVFALPSPKPAYNLPLYEIIVVRGLPDKGCRIACGCVPTNCHVEAALDLIIFLFC